jgi:CARDB
VSFFEDEPQPATQPPTQSPRKKRRSTRSLRVQRLVVALLILFLVVFLLALWIRSCAHDQKVDSYRNYFTSVQAAITQSNAIGKTIKTTINDPGKFTKTSLSRRLDAAERSQQAVLDRVKKLSPPDSLKDGQQALAQAMTVRASGTQQWRDLLTAELKGKNANVTARQLAALGGFFTGPEATYEVLCFTPFKRALVDDGITGVQVPVWNYFLANDPFTLLRLRNMLDSMSTPALGGTHGVGVTKTVAKPSGKILVAGQQVKVPASTDLKFVVSVQNTGTASERNIPVKLVLRPAGSSSPQTQEQTIASLAPGHTEQVPFSGFAISGSALGKSSKVTVKAGPVPREKTLDNNVVQYKVVLQLQ